MVINLVENIFYVLGDLKKKKIIFFGHTLILVKMVLFSEMSFMMKSRNDG